MRELSKSDLRVDEISDPTITYCRLSRESPWRYVAACSESRTIIRASKFYQISMSLETNLNGQGKSPNTHPCIGLYFYLRTLIDTKYDLL